MTAVGTEHEQTCETQAPPTRVLCAADNVPITACGARGARFRAKVYCAGRQVQQNGHTFVFTREQLERAASLINRGGVPSNLIEEHGYAESGIIGNITHAYVDADGWLRVIGETGSEEQIGVTRARQLRTRILNGDITGLSLGVNCFLNEDKSAVTHIDVIETSMVQEPLHEGAVITHVSVDTMKRRTIASQPASQPAS